MLNLIIRHQIISIIKFYQKTLSPDHGLLSFLYPFGYCRFKPTCSDYAIAAFSKYGVVRGLAKSCWRILRCNPFNVGGWDPLK